MPPVSRLTSLRPRSGLRLTKAITRVEKQRPYVFRTRAPPGSIRYLSQAQRICPNTERPCTCKEPCSGVLRLCALFPLQQFGNSVFSTPVLLILRLFYQARSLTFTELSRVSSIKRTAETPRQAAESTTSVPNTLYEKATASPTFSEKYEQLSTLEWYERISADPSSFQDHQVIAITWVKALGSPLSHEFLQVIIEDTTHGDRYRIVTDRDECGDRVIFGHHLRPKNSLYKSEQHELPLPLLSLCFDNSGCRPSVVSLAHLLIETTARSPKYNIMKEMCWWYAETVFEETRLRFGGTLKEWAWARYRYSFVVRSNMIQRKVLAAHAEAFSRQSVDMIY